MSVAVFTAFCEDHRRELEHVIATRTTQTNEVGRCTALLPGLCHIASRYDRDVPLSLLDLGTSAGLNLLFDDYAYTYRLRRRRRRSRPRAPSVRPCRSSAQPATTCARCPSCACPPWASVSASTSPRSTPSPTTPSCGCSPASGRTTRPASAACAPHCRTSAPRTTRRDSSRATWSPTCPAWRRRSPATTPLVVFHSWVAAYLDEDAAAGTGRRDPCARRGRPVHHLYCETPFETPGLPTPPSPVPREGPDLATALVHIGPNGEPERLADTHPHGYWIRWWPATRPGPKGRPGGPAPGSPPR